MEYLRATYEVVDDQNRLQKRADGIAVGLTVGSWTELPQARLEQVREYCGIVHDISVLEVLAGDKVRATITIDYPMRNFNPTMASVLTTVFGKLSMDGQIRLANLEFPPAFERAFPGPKFGVTGLRRRFGVSARPLIMSIFKSSAGLSLSELSAQFYEQCAGGVDLVKDDEIFFSEAYATPEERVVAFAKESERAAEETGICTAYAVNLTGPVTQLRERARRLVDVGANALLLSVYAYGLDALRELAEDSEISVPILAHPAVTGVYYGAPGYGVAASLVLGRWLRTCGADIVLYPSAYGSVTLPKAEGDALVKALREDGLHRASLPAPAAGIHPGLVPLLMRDLGQDLVINAGGAIHGHPMGTAAGGRAFVAAVNATMNGVPLRDAAHDSPELAAALALWGTRDDD